MRFYRLFDADPSKHGAAALTSSDWRAEAKHWNAKGFGIFWTVNLFNGPRKIANLTRICSWAVDIDDGTKDEQIARIAASPLAPSMVIETKRGFQVYWRAKDAKPEHWNSLVVDRLVPFYGADRNARDIARILRVPGFLHLKDPADPFLVTEVHRADVAYTERDIVECYPESTEKAESRMRDEHRDLAKRDRIDADGFWDAVWQLDCREGLERLSGHPAASGEVFKFRRVANGSWNILVDGKGTSCWVDRNGRIGSLDKGGPTLYAWLRWYGNSPRRCVDVIRELFPNLPRR